MAGQNLLCWLKRGETTVGLSGFESHTSSARRVGGRARGFRRPGWAASRNDNGSTPLHIAAASENTYVVTLLPDHPADANVADETLRTLLHLAAAGIPELSSPEIITLLLDADAAINAADKAGDTPLHLAAAHVRTQITETVKLLLARGADNYVSDTVCKVAMGDDLRERAFFPQRPTRRGSNSP